jgi:hypothetical protein
MDDVYITAGHPHPGIDDIYTTTTRKRPQRGGQRDSHRYAEPEPGRAEYHHDEG